MNHVTSAVILEHPSYRRTRNRLRQDPILAAMVHELVQGLGSPAAALEMLCVTTQTTSPAWGLIQAARREYERRGGAQAGHISGPAEALVEMLRDAQSASSSGAGS